MLRRRFHFTVLAQVFSFSSSTADYAIAAAAAASPLIPASFQAAAAAAAATAPWFAAAILPPLFAVTRTTAFLSRYAAATLIYSSTPLPG